MKSIKTLMAMFFVAMLGLTACQQTEDRACQDVADKIKSNETLTDDDYTRMIEYVGAYAEKAQPYVVNDSSTQMQGELDALNKEYPLVQLFRNCIKTTPLDKLSADNQALIQKYGGLIEFDVPEGMTLQTDPQAAGLEVAVPDSANGVVAGAVDQEKVENK